jgi:hypothetical protein
MELYTSAKQGKVRKGTHSCRECKRRKVRCIFASPSDAVCTMCKRRGSRCTSQWDISNTDATSQSTTYANITFVADSISPGLVTDTDQRGSESHVEQDRTSSHHTSSRPGEAEVSP